MKRAERTPVTDRQNEPGRPFDPDLDTATPNELNPAARFLGSHISRLIISPTRKRIFDGIREQIRKLRGEPHRVHYFHEIADPYSHLAAQTLRGLLAAYEIELIPHLATPTKGQNVPEPELLARLAERDARAVAPHYGLAFPAARAGGAGAAGDTTHRAARALAHAARDADPGVFADLAVQIGAALFAGDEAATRRLADQSPLVDASDADRALDEGRALRERMGHYSGAMFHYAGEWFWGVDRLIHLERRLIALGAARDDRGPRFPRPPIPRERVPRAAELSLEFFPSLRSPYTAIAFEPTLALARDSGIKLETRPVLPMVMRGVPVTLAKSQYIASDTLREAGLLGVGFGRIYDPIGDPVRRGFALWHWAREQGRGDAFLSAFARGAFAEGINTSRDTGRRRLVESVGLDWSEAARHLDDTAWEAELERNRLVMMDEMGQWGVPSYRLRGPVGEPELCVWGQDRLWLLAHEIQRRGRLPAGPAA
jgi:2-hydroxychromene-2-carboxylate isomerase